MTNWYKDIYPCSVCEHNPVIGSGCRKGHETTYVGGCSRCGTKVNYGWYFNRIKCIDFKYKEQDDPSGS